jgi:Glycosidases
MNENYLSKIHDLLIFIYGRGKGDDTFIALKKSLKSPPLQGEKKARRRAPLSEKDVCLIAYGDMLAASETGTGGSSETGLGRLEKFLRLYDRGYFSFLHLLPFHPYSSDDGFSVIDYAAVDPRFGNWGDIRALSHKYKLMFDFVLNHGSAQSAWFRSFLKNEAPRRGWYIEKPSDYDPSGVFRPRTSPLLTAFPRDDGSSAHIWTTFGPDQVDYNFAEPGVFLEFLRIFLEYVQRGAKIVRLDAIAYLWKEDGTNCIHHAKNPRLCQTAARHHRLFGSRGFLFSRKQMYLTGKTYRISEKTMKLT